MKRINLFFVSGLCFMLICLAFSLNFLSAPYIKAADWTDYAASSLDGDGSSTSPFIISTAEELAYLSKLSETNNFAGKYFEQTANIDLTGRTLKPIATNASFAFAGNYDGKSFKIKNLTCNTLSYNALFGVIDGANIKLIILQANINVNGNFTAGLVAKALNSNITSCFVYGNVNSNNNSTNTVAGICADAFKSNFNQCINFANVTGKAGYIGGVVGYIKNDSDIFECINYGNISAKNSGTTQVTYIGGIAGICEGSDAYPAIKGGFNLGNVTIDCNSVSQTSYAGGIYGYDGIVHCESSYSGGIVSGAVINGVCKVGGLAGYKNWSVMFNVYTFGGIIGESYNGLFGDYTYCNGEMGEKVPTADDLNKDRTRDYYFSSPYVNNGYPTFKSIYWQEQINQLLKKITF